MIDLNSIRSRFEASQALREYEKQGFWKISHLEKVKEYAPVERFPLSVSRMDVDSETTTEYLDWKREHHWTQRKVQIKKKTMNPQRHLDRRRVCLSKVWLSARSSILPWCTLARKRNESPWKQRHGTFECHGQDLGWFFSKSVDVTRCHSTKFKNFWRQWNMEVLTKLSTLPLPLHAYWKDMRFKRRLSRFYHTSTKPVPEA